MLALIWAIMCWNVIIEHIERTLRTDEPSEPELKRTRTLRVVEPNRTRTFAAVELKRTRTLHFEYRTEPRTLSQGFDSHL